MFHFNPSGVADVDDYHVDVETGNVEMQMQCGAAPSWGRFI